MCTYDNWYIFLSKLAVADAWDRGSMASVTVCLPVRAPKGKWLELAVNSRLGIHTYRVTLWQSLGMR